MNNKERSWNLLLYWSVIYLKISSCLGVRNIVFLFEVEIICLVVIKITCISIADPFLLKKNVSYLLVYQLVLVYLT